MEYCKAYSRTRRWKEQVQLLHAEMQYCLVSLEHEAKEWESRAVVAEFSGDHAEGAQAYGLKQARVRRLIANQFRVQWAKHLTGMATVEPAPLPATGPFVSSDDYDNDSDEELGESDAEQEEAAKEAGKHARDSDSNTESDESDSEESDDEHRS